MRGQGFDVVVLGAMAKNRNKKNNGYTLIEVIVTMIVLGVIASLAIPNYIVSVERTKASEGAQMLEALLNAQRRHSIENDGDYATDTAQLDISFTVGTKNFNDPKVDSNGARLAEIERSTGQYVLYINDDGVISCEEAATNLCPKLGCNPECNAPH